MELYNDDCLIKMKDISNNSIDLLFCDLPYGQTSCKWDCLIDLDLFWKEVNRICKDDAAMFFTCSTKFGVSLINSNPKNFRYDLVWVKSSPCGFLNAKKMPMKKHEMVYVFYKKLPKVYTDNIAEHHTHKFIKETENKRNGKDGVDNKGMIKNRCEKETVSKYDPPLPTSVIKDDTFIRGKETSSKNEDVYNSNERMKNGKLYHHARSKQKGDEPIYDPPLPTSVIRNDEGCNSMYGKETGKIFIYDENGKLRNSEPRYDPPLPTSVIKDDNLCNYDVNKNAYGGGKEGRIIISKDKREHETRYDPPLPNSILEIASQKGKHATQKPVDLIKWCLKYYSKEGDVILDPTMGSGSTGVACKEMNRNFIGIEMDKDIYEVACKRLE